MIKQLDASPMTSADLKVFQLKYADAFNVSKADRRRVQAQRRQQQCPVSSFSATIPPQQPKGGMKVNVTSDDRTNSLIVSAPPS